MDYSSGIALLESQSPRAPITASSLAAVSTYFQHISGLSVIHQTARPAHNQPTTRSDLQPSDYAGTTRCIRYDINLNKVCQLK